MAVRVSSVRANLGSSSVANRGHPHRAQSMLSSALAPGTAALMRILVADQNAMLLAAVASTFGRHCVIVTATRRDACLEHLANERFDVVVACEKLRDFTGLELLSEVETLSPHTLRIFAAPAERLARLGSRLDHFGLLGTLSYPLDPRKLLLALKVARTKLPPRPKVRHVVLESEWDTGERLGLLEQELEVEPAAPPTLVAAAPEKSIPAAAQRSIPVAPVAVPVARVAKPAARAVLPPTEASVEVSFDENPNLLNATAPQAPVGKPIRPGTRKAAGAQGRGDATPTKAPSVQAPPAAPLPPALPVDTDLAANDPAFETKGGEKTLAKPGPKPAAAAKAQPAPAAAAKKGTPTGPRPRQPSVPTAAQRQAFQRAVARRNAARQGSSGQVDTNTDGGRASVQQAGDASGTFRPHWHGTHSLTDLARMATTKRPLTQTSRPLLPKRKVFVVGSGVAAVLLASVLAFELTGSHAPTHHSRRAVTAQLFSPNANLVAENNATDSPSQVFGAPPAPPGEVSTPSPASNLPQPEVFDPNTAPEDPPPPPALERPGPMEPPSMGHSGPPLGMQDGSTDTE